MVTLHYDQRRKEADFRFGLVRVRENAEFIALYRGEKQEGGGCAVFSTPCSPTTCA